MGLNADFGGSWKRIGPSLLERILASARKALSRSGVHARLASCVMALGALTEKRKFSGTEVAHFSQVEERCER